MPYRRGGFALTPPSMVVFADLAAARHSGVPRALCRRLDSGHQSARVQRAGDRLCGAVRRRAGAAAVSTFIAATARPYSGRWRKLPTGPARVLPSSAIRPSIRRRIRPSRRAPRPTGRKPRRSRPRSRNCSTPASARAPPAPARRPGCSRRPTIPTTRRADFAAAHTARKSTPRGFNETPQSGYAGKGTLVDPDLAQTLGLDSADELATSGITATTHALDRLLREGRPEFERKAWVPHRPPRPEKSEGGRKFVIKSDFEPRGDQPQAIEELVEGVNRARPHAGAARRHRLGQDLHHGQGDRAHPAPGADPRAQQDAGRPALRRVQELLPRQRGRVFRLLLRLLPAGSLCPAHRHLYREGILDQRADRPHAPFGDARAARARRRHHRRLGVVHLRYRLGRDLFGDDVHAQAGRASRPAPAARRSGRAAIPPHRRRLLPRHLPGARRLRRDLPRPLRGPRLAHQSVRRRDRADRRVRSAHRAEDRRARFRQDLRQLALCDAAADAAAGHPGHQDRAAPAPRGAQPHGPPAGSAAAGAAHPVRSRNDGGDRLLRRHRELFALSHRPPAGRAAADPVRICARPRARLRRREPRHRPAARRHVSRRLPPQGDARRIRLPPALLHGQPAAALRGMGRDAAADLRRFGDAGTVGARPVARRVRRAGDPADRPDRSGGRGAARRAPRSTTCSAKCGRPRPTAFARWSPC